MKINIQVTQPRKRTIAQYDMNGCLIKEWDNYNDIFIELGFLTNYIQNCIRGVCTKAYGYKWGYKYY